MGAAMIAHLFSMLLGAALLWTGTLAFLLNRGSPYNFVGIVALAIVHLIIQKREERF